MRKPYAPGHLQKHKLRLRLAYDLIDLLPALAVSGHLDRLLASLEDPVQHGVESLALMRRIRRSEGVHVLFIKHL